VWVAGASRYRLAAAIGWITGTTATVLGTFDTSSAYDRLQAPWGASLFVATCAACAVYGYGRDEGRAVWTSAWVTALTLAVLQGAAVALNADGPTDPDDPVMTPAGLLVLLPLLLALTGAGVAVRRRRNS
jgi:hypothetical protein